MSSPTLGEPGQDLCGAELFGTRDFGSRPAHHPVVRGIGEEVAAERLALFSEIGVPWAGPNRWWRGVHRVPVTP